MSLKRKKCAAKTQRLSKAWLYLLGFLGNSYRLCNLKTAYLHETGNNSKTASWRTLTPCFSFNEAQFPVICVKDHTNRTSLWSGLTGDEEKPISGTGVLDSQHPPWESSSRQGPGSLLLLSLEKPGELAAGAKNAAWLLHNIHTPLMDWDNPPPFANGKQQEQRAKPN